MYNAELPEIEEVNALVKNKEKWDGLPDVERRDFITRVTAESDFKYQLREGQAEYKPVNYYG